MSLAAKLAIRIAALVVGLVLLAGVSLYGLVTLETHLATSERKSFNLRGVYEIGHHAATARTLSRITPLDRSAVRASLEAASFVNESLYQKHPEQREALARIRAQLRSAMQHLDAADPAAPLPPIHGVLNEVARIARQIEAEITANRDQADAHLRTTIRVITAAAALLLIFAIAIGVKQYRSVMTPLRQLEAALERLAAGDFEARVPTRGDREFAQLARNVNRMAQELGELYRGLEAQVNAKSAQLVRSERLASVGYLAAGVAHEINNPLGIITGYAESALRQIDPASNGASEKAAKSLRIICEEAFRCKAITEKLLTLARPGHAQRSRIDPAAVAERVAALVADLPQFRDRTLRVDRMRDERAAVLANEGEITQVLLNLICNALEAVSPGGEVVVASDRRGEWAVIEVRDNGRGMTPEAMSHLFEPFFTDKPQRGERGTGLGLAVAHAIVEQHGGRLRGHSDGAGRGSVFTLELPAQENPA